MKSELCNCKRCGTEVLSRFGEYVFCEKCCDEIKKNNMKDKVILDAKDIKNKIILDACCGGRMFWFDKNHPNTLYVDKRICEKGHYKEKPNHCVKPDIVMDFRDLQFEDEKFNLVVFDPPHLFLGETSKFAKDFGRLNGTDWKVDIKKGFAECFRVLKPLGILVFKWNEFDIPVKEILKLTSEKPLFGHISGKRSGTHWICFMKFSPQ